MMQRESSLTDTGVSGLFSNQYIRGILWVCLGVFLAVGAFLSVPLSAWALPGDTFVADLAITGGQVSFTPAKFIVIDEAGAGKNGTVQIGSGTLEPAIDKATAGTPVLSAPVSRTVAGGAVAYDIVAIGDRAFRECTALEGTGIAGSAVVRVGYEAFCWCTSLKDTELSGSAVAELGVNAFRTCTSLVTTGLAGNTNITEIPFSAFYECRSLKETGLAQSAVKTVGYEAFFWCLSLTDTGLAGSPVTKLESGVFRNCMGLTTTGLAGNLAITELPTSVFYECKSLTDTGLAQSAVTKVGYEAFCGCTALTDTGLASSTVVELGAHAFRRCESLVVTGLKPVMAVGDYCFYECKKLKTIVAGSMDCGAVLWGTDCFYGIADNAALFCSEKERSAWEACFAAQDITNPTPYGCSVLIDPAFPKSIVQGGEIGLQGLASMRLTGGLGMHEPAPPRTFVWGSERPAIACLVGEGSSQKLVGKSVGLSDITACLSVENIAVDAEAAVALAVEGTPFAPAVDPLPVDPPAVAAPEKKLSSPAPAARLAKTGDGVAGYTVFFGALSAFAVLAGATRFCVLRRQDR